MLNVAIIRGDISSKINGIKIFGKISVLKYIFKYAK